MEYIKEYTKFLEKFLDASGKVRVLFDLSNGSAGLIVKELLKDKENIEAVFINDEMDGNFPGHGPNPLDKGVAEFMKNEVVKNKVDMGVVFDGDGDRAFFFDDLGDPLGSYEIFDYIKGYFSAPYVVDVRALPQLTMPDENVVETKVGRYFVVQAMKENDAGLGVEYSGHFYFKNFFYTDSGILASIYMLNYLSRIKNEGKILSDMKRDSHLLCLPEVNFTVDSPQEAILKMQEYFSKQNGVRIETLDGLTVYGKDFALNIRSSATEPVVRFTLAAKENEVLETIHKETKKVLGINE